MYERMIGLIRENIPRDSVVLDIGTGSGVIPLRIFDIVQRIEAVDLSEKMIEVAREKAMKQSAGNITFHVGDSGILPFDDGTFDAVIASNLLHIVPEPVKVLAEARRVLKDSGVLIAPTYVHGESLKSRTISFILRLKGHRLYSKFNSSSLKHCIESNRFTVTSQILLKNIMPLSYVEAKKR